MKPWVPIMNKDAAEKYLVAARDNPFVAAWVAVLDFHKCPSHAEIAGGDWFDAFQEFYLYGLVSEEHMQRIDIDKTFFRNRRPSGVEIQQTLNNLRVINSMSEEEDPVANFNVFDSDKAIVHQGRIAPTTVTRQVNVFETSLERGQPVTRGEFEVFQDRPLPSMPEPRKIEPFQESMVTPRGGKIDPAPYVENVNFQILCCGIPLELVEDDSDLIDPGESEGEADHFVLEMVCHATCPACGTAHHHSAAKPTSRDIFK